MTLSAIHNCASNKSLTDKVVCDIGGYDFVSYSQPPSRELLGAIVVCDIGGYDFVSYSQRNTSRRGTLPRCL